MYSIFLHGLDMSDFQVCGKVDVVRHRAGKPNGCPFCYLLPFIHVKYSLLSVRSIWLGAIGGDE
jgi:hypothetical protein